MNPQYVTVTKAIVNSYKINVNELSVLFSNVATQVCEFFKSEGFIDDYQYYVDIKKKKKKIVKTPRIKIRLKTDLNRLNLPINQKKSKIKTMTRSVPFPINMLNRVVMQPFHSIQFLSTPSRFFFISSKDLKKKLRWGVMTVLLTSKGVLSGEVACKHNLGGLLLYKIYV